MSGNSVGRTWTMRTLEVELRGWRRRLRLVEFRRAWLASVDAPDGPTLGASESPYLAVAQALDDIGAADTDALRLTGELLRAPGQPLTDATEPIVR